MTRPPVASIRSLSWVRFVIARTVLFPLTKLTLADTQAETVKLDHLLTEVADRHGVSLIQPEPSWYGLDPIHVRRRYQHAAFARILAEWMTASDTADEERPLLSRLKKRPLAELRWLCGREIRTHQPVVVADDISVFAY